MDRGYDEGFGKYLIEHGLISAGQLAEAESLAEGSGEDPDDVLVRLGHISPEKHNRCLSSYLGIPFTDVDVGRIEQAAVASVPFEMVHEFRVFPVLREGDVLTLVTCRPLSLDAQELLAFNTGCELKLLLCDEEDFDEACRHFYPEECIQHAVSQPAKEEIEYLGTAAEEREGRAEPPEIVEDQIIDLVDSLIAGAIRKRASDIHIEPYEKATRIRVRVDGVLSEEERIPGNIHEAVVSRVKILSNLDITERRRPQDGVIFLRYGKKDVDLRVATSPTIYGESVSLRILDQSKAGVTLDRLGFSPADLDRTLAALDEPYGFILSTGPTGSGKTTTMYALINQLDKSDKKIITIEDPVEYRIGGIIQIPINRSIDLGFDDMLRSVLRQDPNVILVGEIRDPETAHTAVQAALTGHLMLSTLHTTDAPEVMLRLMEIGIEHYYVREVVKLIIAQRLARKLCAKCREPYTASASELAEMGVSGEGVTLYAARGCEACLNTGYLDRTGVFEVMPVTGEMRDIMAPGVRLADLMDIATEQGMRTLWQNGVAKVLAGETTIDEIRRVLPRETLWPAPSAKQEK